MCIESPFVNSNAKPVQKRAYTRSCVGLYNFGDDGRDHSCVCMCIVIVILLYKIILQARRVWFKFVALSITLHIIYVNSCLCAKCKNGDDDDDDDVGVSTSISQLCSVDNLA